MPHISMNNLINDLCELLELHPSKFKCQTYITEARKYTSDSLSIIIVNMFSFGNYKWKTFKIKMHHPLALPQHQPIPQL